MAVYWGRTSVGGIVAGGFMDGMDNMNAARFVYLRRKENAVALLGGVRTILCRLASFVGTPPFCFAGIWFNR